MTSTASSNSCDQFYSETLNDTHHPYLTFLTLNQLKIRQQFCDIELRIGEARFNAHLIVLAASSPYLLKLVTSKPSTVSHITLSDPNLQIYAVELLIDFIYTSIIKITQTTVRAICYASKTLNLVRAEKACCKFMLNCIQTTSMTCTQLLEYLLFAIVQDYKTLQVKCVLQLTKMVDSLVTNDLFLTLCIDQAYQLLKLFDPASTFELLVKWIDHDHNSRRQYGAILTNQLNISIPIKYHINLNQNGEKPAPLTRQELPNDTKLKHCLTVPTSKNIYVAGGNTNHDISTTADVEMFDTKEQTWKCIPNLSRKKSHSSLVAGGGQLYLIGGFDGVKRTSSVEIYSLTLGQWINCPSLKYPRSGCGAAVFRKEIYVIGGYNGSDHMTSVEIFNPTRNEWRDGPSLKQPRSYVQAAVMGGILYVVGGADNNGRLSLVEKLTDSSHQWSKAPSMTVARSRPGVDVMNGKTLYACGGYDGKSHLDTIECLEIGDKKWRLLGTMPTARNSPGVCAIKNNLYIFGGYSGRCILDTMDIYDTDTNQWSQGPPLLNPCCDFGYTTGTLAQLTSTSV